jgi:Xaa-Pro aminopeptidase
VSQVHAGDTERDLAKLIEESYTEAGGDRLEMLVVGSGTRSAHLNAPASNRRLELGDVVRIDVIGTCANYYSDVARTAVVGDPDTEQRHIYGVLQEIHERIVDTLRPGTLCSDLFGVYEQGMQRAALPPYHFVGHGLGITLHEEPFLNAVAPTRLEEGMVLCVEPLTTIDGRFGMQIEDEILITADGCEQLTRADGLLRIAA